MCVIATSYKGFDVPAKPVMKDMYDYNPDGAGFAYALNKRVYIEKGFMTYEDFIKALDALQTKLQDKYNKTLKDISIMFHFRIGTHGPNSPELTHPFPISHKKKHFDALDLYTDVVMAHNGIIKSVTPVTDWSDTTQYVKDILHPLYMDNKEFYKSENVQHLIANTINGSRFVFLDKNGEFTYIGDWHESDEADLKGNKFSNLNHEDTYLRYYNAYSTYDYYDYTENKKAILVKELPVGTILCNNLDFGPDFTYDVSGKSSVVGSAPTKWFVDEVGDIYVDYNLGYLVKSYLYDIAIADFTNYAIWNYYCSMSPELDAYPLLEKTLMTYKYNTPAKVKDKA
jgi:predicted glutamine amidotransferase